MGEDSERLGLILKWWFGEGGKATGLVVLDLDWCDVPRLSLSSRYDDGLMVRVSIWHGDGGRRFYNGLGTVVMTWKRTAMVVVIVSCERARQGMAGMG
ncbi:hypothetical protein M0R45_026252 [Rubus argutus]|uniref:Uncharacterized protein n=1 Tax=Rubus argutus TaxID=59490 RepID=A0AAW1WZA8_RUBAR